MTEVCDDDDVYSPQHTMCVCVYSCVTWHARSIEDWSLRIQCVAVVVIGVTLEEHALPSWYGTTTPVYVPPSPRHEKPTAFLPARASAGLEWATVQKILAATCLLPTQPSSDRAENANTRKLLPCKEVAPFGGTSLRGQEKSTECARLSIKRHHRGKERV